VTLPRAVFPLLVLTLSTFGCGGATTPVSPSVLPAAIAAVAPASNDVRRWTITGTVHDSDDGFAVEGVAVQLSDRFDPRATTTDAAGRYVFSGVAESGVRMVFTRQGYRDLTIEQVLPVEDLVIDVTMSRACTPRPSPVMLSYQVSNGRVIFTWPETRLALEYRLSVGQWDHVSPVFSVTTASTSYEWENPPSGTYHARVQGRSACGYGNAANELKVIVP
jgi:hypothetical protein